MSVGIVPYGYTKAKTLQLPHLRRISLNYCAWKHQKEIILDIYIYIDIY